MRALIQRVSQAKVTVNNEVTGEIGPGLLVFLGVTHEDTEKDVEYLLEKVVNMRLFGSEKSQFDHSILDVKGELLVVSQFTLYGSTKKGRRPDFTASARPEVAEPLYEFFIEKACQKGLKTASGRFGAMMEVSLVNDGPVTLMIESR